MTIKEYIELVFTDYTLRTITLGTAVLGAICGMLGSFAVLRKQSLLGDAIFTRSTSRNCNRLSNCWG